ncbi:MAG: hypothetical protein FJ265_20450, partial [Planctomycetes bacterium]|nr:hypothetical protein [Planctomycetota bacterium]
MPKRWRQALWSILPLLACAFPAPAQSPLVDAKELRSLPRIARDLAAQGHAAEWRDLVAALAALGLPAKELDALRRDGEKVLAIRKKPAAKTAALAKALRDECARLDRRLVGRNDAAAREVARHLLVLDADCAHANGVLGREFVEGRWTVAGAAARSARRAELLAALQRARTLEVPIEIDEGDGNTADGKASGAFLLAEVLGRQVVRARCGQVVVHSMKSAAQTERMLRQTIRALAFAAFAAGKPFALPAAGAAQIVWIDSRPIYVQVAAAALQRGLISAPMHAEALQLDGFYLSNGALVDFGRLESEFETALLIALDGDRFGTEMVVAGFCNWVCMNFLGTAIPRYAWTETTERRLARAQRTTTETEAERVLREEMLRLADAGIAGSRSYLRYLAERRLDPPWIDAME